MQLDLLPHANTPPGEPAFRLWANAEYSGAFGASATLNLWFGIDAPLARFRTSPLKDVPERGGELWRTTCFEAFIRPADEECYREWNFAPSGDWEAYDFSAPRQDRSKAAVDHPPYVRVEDNMTWWTLGATIALEAGRDWRLGLSAVIEEEDGTKSYWALVHCSTEPDFHDPATFTTRLG